MNSSIFIIKIISKPKIKIFSNHLFVTKVMVQQGKFRKKKKSFDTFEVLLWGSFGLHFHKLYCPGDYLILEGHLGFKKGLLQKLTQKNVQFTVKKYYPFLLTELETEKNIS